VDGRAAGAQRRVPLLRKRGRRQRLGGAAQGNRRRLGEVRALVPVWVVRTPPPSDPRADPDLDTLLPDGFLERTTGRRFVVKLWAPQVDVLHHRATGAFVTHCRWNSVLERITASVPMVCWPLYAEQEMNKVFIVEYGSLCRWTVNGWRHGRVQAEEVEAKVRLVMESGEGERLRTRVTEHKRSRPWRGKTAAHRAWRSASCWTPRAWCVPVERASAIQRADFCAASLFLPHIRTWGPHDGPAPSSHPHSAENSLSVPSGREEAHDTNHYSSDTYNPLS
jgi:hypothetical protein